MPALSNLLLIILFLHPPLVLVSPLFLLMWIDDLIVTENNIVVINALKLFLHKRFSIKDLGTLKYFLGIKVARCTKGIFLSQRKYTLELLDNVSHLSSQSPMEQNLKLTLFDGALLVDLGTYRWFVGRFIYLTIIRSDIVNLVQILSQFMNKPTPYLEVAHRVLHYLKSSPGKGILLPSSSSLNITAYYDSNWAICSTTRHSITGYCTFPGHSPISWKS